MVGEDMKDETCTIRLSSHPLDGKSFQIFAKIGMQQVSRYDTQPFLIPTKLPAHRDTSSQSRKDSFYLSLICDIVDNFKDVC